jgi:hypothetical protein
LDFTDCGSYEKLGFVNSTEIRKFKFTRITTVTVAVSVLMHSRGNI